MLIGWRYDENEGNVKYYYNAAGQMLTGWQTILTKHDGARRFYFDNTGKFIFGEVKIGANTYFFDQYLGMLTGIAYNNKLYQANGTLAQSLTKVDGKVYYANQGVYSKNEWITIGRNRYFFHQNGYALTGYVDLTDDYWFNKLDKLEHPYLFNNEGVMLTGWQTINGSRYFVEPGGRVKHGIHNDRGSLYYFNNRGEMQFGRHSVDGNLYFFDPASGRAMRGLINDGADYYFVNNSNQITSGWQTIAGRRYYFAESNLKAVRNALYEIGGKTYYFDEHGVMFRGWRDIGLYRYFFDNSGAMVKGTALKLNNRWYGFDEEGRLLREGEQFVGTNPYPAYFAANGELQTGLVEMGGNYYFYDANGIRLNGFRINNKTYLFDAEGRLHKSVAVFDGDPFYQEDDSLVSGFFKAFGEYYFMGARNTLYKNGWLNVGRERYYFSESGKALRNGRKTIQGKQYHFAEDGKLLRGVHKFNELYYIADANGVLYSADSTKVTLVQGKEYRIDWHGTLWLGMAEISNEQYKIFDLEIQGDRYYFGDNATMQTG